MVLNKIPKPDKYPKPLPHDIKLEELSPRLRVNYLNKKYSVEKIRKMIKGEVCFRCGAHPPRPGFKSCVKCVSTANSYRKNNRPKFRETEKKYWGKNQEKYKEKNLRHHLKDSHNISIERFKELEKGQDGVCAICFRPASGNHILTSRLFVDHNHQTGKIRGLLCGLCNTAIGHFKEDITILHSAISYLNKHLSEASGGREANTGGK